MSCTTLKTVVMRNDSPGARSRPKAVRRRPGQVVPGEQAVVGGFIRHRLGPDETQVVRVVGVQQWQDIYGADADVGDDDGEGDVVRQHLVQVGGDQLLIQRDGRV
jgi:hypothetical protein